MKKVAKSQDKKPPVKSPVVTVMGHVDHGKTLLLDAIRDTDVVASEKGGITQHIGAYKIKTKGGEITFIDTPGHEAFTAMRARGAKATDIVVLVVAASEGVMPQTVEAINHAKSAEVPIIVAINKIDLPEANPDRVKKQLMEHGLLDEKLGGTTLFCEVSAKKKKGLKELLSTILLEAEMLELQSNPKKPAEGVVIEAKIDKGRGPVATVLIQDGTLRLKDIFVANSNIAKVRAMFDDSGESIKEAGPSTPVEVLGFSFLAKAGDTFKVISENQAREIEKKSKEQVGPEFVLPKLTLETLFARIEKKEIKELPLIIKADVTGTKEAICTSLEKLSFSKKARLVIIHSGVGSILESDIMLAKSANGMVIGFNIKPEARIKMLAEKEAVKIYTYDVIYKLIEDIEKATLGLLPPEYREKAVGRAVVKQVFKIKKELIAGCLIEGGKAQKGAKARVIRLNNIIGEGSVSSLKRFKEDVSEVKTGLECGISLDGINDIKEADAIEMFIKEEVK
ncbi:MAG: translation initiation factor IF-2 [bacterium]|nr:translation initiation factor IF-2 [bacterium]